MNFNQFVASAKAAVERRSGVVEREDAPLSVSEQVAKSVRLLIMRGEVLPGARLLETELAERFQVSRAPVREALRILHKDGIVEINPRRGAQVYQPDARDIANLYEIRGELFALSARKAAALMDEELLALCQRGVKHLAAFADDPNSTPQQFLQARAALSSLINTAANNPKLSDLITLLSAQAVMHLRVFESADDRRVYARSWGRLVDFIAARDEDQAADCARSLSLGSRDAILRLVKGGGAADGEPTVPPRPKPTVRRNRRDAALT